MNDWKTLLSWRPSLLDLLRLFPSTTPPLHRLIDVLAPLAPRYYSITTSPLSHPRSVSIVFNVVDFKVHDKVQRLGVSTTWLDKHTGLVSPAAAIDQPMPCNVDLTIPLFPRLQNDFRPPADISVSYIMVTTFISFYRISFILQFGAVFISFRSWINDIVIKNNSSSR
jgi:methionine synthase reductase